MCFYLTSKVDCMGLVFNFLYEYLNLCFNANAIVESERGARVGKASINSRLRMLQVTT